MNWFFKSLACITVLLTGLSAGAALAHLLKLPNKMPLSAAEYLWVQQHLYSGFGRVLGPVELGAFLSALALTTLLRKHRLAFLLGLAASICSAVALIIWQLHNDPVNAAVAAWTIDTLPPDWVIYRDRWEYAHAARAGLYTLSLGIWVLAVLSLDAKGPKGFQG
jgi:uncharacterized membrane protein